MEDKPLDQTFLVDGKFYYEHKNVLSDHFDVVGFKTGHDAMYLKHKFKVHEHLDPSEVIQMMKVQDAKLEGMYMNSIIPFVPMSKEAMQDFYGESPTQKTAFEKALEAELDEVKKSLIDETYQKPMFLIKKESVKLPSLNDWQQAIIGNIETSLDTKNVTLEKLKEEFQKHDAPKKKKKDKAVYPADLSIPMGEYKKLLTEINQLKYHIQEQKNLIWHKNEQMSYMTQELIALKSLKKPIGGLNPEPYKTDKTWHDYYEDRDLFQGALIFHRDRALAFKEQGLKHYYCTQEQYAELMNILYAQYCRATNLVHKEIHVTGQEVITPYEFCGLSVIVIGGEIKIILNDDDSVRGHYRLVPGCTNPPLTIYVARKRSYSDINNLTPNELMELEKNYWRDVARYNEEFNCYIIDGKLAQ